MIPNNGDTAMNIDRAVADKLLAVVTAAESMGLGDHDDQFLDKWRRLQDAVAAYRATETIAAFNAVTP
jgi:hypothetical protein